MSGLKERFEKSKISFQSFAENAINIMKSDPSNCELFERLFWPIAYGWQIFKGTSMELTIKYGKRLQEIHFPHCSSNHQT